MAVGTEVVAVRYEDIAAGTPISVPMPLYEALDAKVYYGVVAPAEAVYNTDYTITLGDDFDTFTLVPTASLLTKINALIAADPTGEENYITVRRRLDYLTDSTAAAVRYTPFTSREFERTVLRFQQIQEQLNRCIALTPNFVGNEPRIQIAELEPNRVLMADPTGERVIAGPTADEVESAQAHAEAALASKNAAAISANNAAGSASASAGSAAAAAASAAAAEAAAGTNLRFIKNLRADVVADEPEVDPEFYNVLFYDDSYIAGAEATYRKVSSEPSHVGKLQNGNGTWYEISVPYTTPEMFGAKGDDTANDAGAFIDAQTVAMAIGANTIVVPGRDYLINSQIVIASRSNWIMRNPVLRTSLDSMTIMLANGVNDWSIDGRAQLRGSLITSEVTSQYGLIIVDCDRYRVNGVTAFRLKGKGFYLYGSGTGTTALRGDRGQFSDCAAYECTVGRQLDAGAGAEYTTWTNWNASGCIDADIIGAGNCATVGGSIVDNYARGVVLVGGPNHGHGIYSGTQINHNPVNLEATGVTNGYSFEGCHWYEGDINITNCAGIVLDGGVLDPPDITVMDGAGAGYNYIRNMSCIGGYGPILVTGTGRSKLVMQNNLGPGALNMVRDSNHAQELGAYRVQDSTQALTAGVGTVLTFTASYKDTTEAFSAGVFTVPEDMGGVYTVEWNLIFNGTAMDATASYISLQADNGGDDVFADNVLIVCNPFSTTKLVANGSASLRYSAGSKLRFNAIIRGTSPVFGDGDWFCLVSIRRTGA